MTNPPEQVAMFLLLIVIQLTAAQDLPPKYGCTLHHLKSNDPIKQDFHISGRLNYLSPNKLNHNPFNDFDRLLDMGLCLEATVSYHAGVLRTSINCINSTQSSRVPFPRISLENVRMDWADCKRTRYEVFVDQQKQKLLLTGSVQSERGVRDANGILVINLSQSELGTRFGITDMHFFVRAQTSCVCSYANDFELHYLEKSKNYLEISAEFNMLSIFNFCTFLIFFVVLTCCGYHVIVMLTAFLSKKMASY